MNASYKKILGDIQKMTVSNDPSLPKPKTDEDKKLGLGTQYSKFGFDRSTKQLPALETPLSSIRVRKINNFKPSVAEMN